LARQDLDDTLDTLVIDETGARWSRRGRTPEGTGVSALEHLLGEHPTVPPYMGSSWTARVACTRTSAG
jgi:hypothetical protein